MKRCHTAALLLALTLTQATSVNAAPKAEQILAQATRYTVKINLITSIGLNQDDGSTGHGAGFLIDRQRGWILTNAHVATRSPATLKASFKGGNLILATRVHVDAILDAAIIKIDPKLIPDGTPEAELDCSGLPAAGTPVAAFGHPWGLSFIATRGIVSGVPWIYPSENIQSDATINSGNSGGPLIDLDTGKVIGLNSSTYNVHKDANSTPVSLAEPMPHICKIVELLKAGKDASLRLLPVTLATEDEDARPRVARLLDKTSALRPGDLILGINGALGVRNLTDLSTRLRGHPGPVTVNVERNGQPLDLASSTRAVPDPLKVKAINLSGLIITPPWRLDDYEFNPEGLLVVDYIILDSDAGISKAGAADVIQTVNGVAYRDLDVLRKDLSGLPNDAQVQIILGGYAREGAYLREYRIITLPRGPLNAINLE